MTDTPHPTSPTGPAGSSGPGPGGELVTAAGTDPVLHDVSAPSELTSAGGPGRAVDRYRIRVWPARWRRIGRWGWAAQVDVLTHWDDDGDQPLLVRPLWRRGRHEAVQACLAYIDVDAGYVVVVHHGPDLELATDPTDPAGPADATDVMDATGGPVSRGWSW